MAPSPPTPLQRVLQGIGMAGALCVADAAAADPLRYPPTRQVDQVDTYHGVAVPDPYRWLEDDNSDETRAWVASQNAVTDAFLERIPQREPIRKLYTALFDFEKFGVPFHEAGRYFWIRNDGLQQQAVLYTADRLDGPPRVALDPNTLSADGTVALAGTAPSRDGRLLAYGVAGGGSDWQAWRVRDLSTGADLPDRIDWVKFSRADWTPDGKGFFYARYAAPADGAALTGANEFQKLYYHRLGTPQADDVLVAENPADKEWGFETEVSDDGRWLLITVWKSAARKNGLMVLPLADGGYAGGEPRPLSLDFDATYNPIGTDGDTLFMYTDRDAPRGRLVAVDLKNPSPDRWKTLVAEGPDAMTGATAVGGRLLPQYLRDASTLVRVHAADGTLVREVALPGVGTASGFGGRWRDRETFFSFASPTQPPSVYRLDLNSGAVSLFKQPQTAFDPSKFETRREFVTSKDGTRFPVFISHRKGLALNGESPTLLHGYGGFNVPNTPGYSVRAAAWMQMGGVFVSASIRGGGEYGAAWHEAGTRLKKQNVFDDFIAAAEWLIDRKVTRPSRLGVPGGSNGGLLVAAVVNQRPELFGAAVPAVGVLDMLRFHRFTIGWAWVSDYGSADDPAQFKALHAYSPLHNIRSGVRYPAVLVTTADHDDRVVPAHSFKYAAALQAADTGPAPKLIRIETRAGHGAGKPTSMVIAEQVDVLSFLAQAFDMPVR